MSVSFTTSELIRFSNGIRWEKNMDMRKTLAGTGIVLTGILGTAHAETQVTLYGLLDAGVAYQTGKAGTKDLSRGVNGGSYHSRLGFGSGEQSRSRWGLRGTEDLGDGWQAVFNIESQFDIGSGDEQQSGRLFGRRATVGLARRGIGVVELGRQRNIASDFFSSIDPFGIDFLQANMGTAFSAANDVRYDNSIMFRSDSWNGFRVGFGYSFNYDDVDKESRFQTTSNNHAVTAGLAYQDGPLDVALTYDQQFRYPDQPQPKQAILGAAYDFEVIKVSAAYGWTKDGVLSAQDFALIDGAGNPNTPASGTGTTNDDFTWDGLKINSYMVGLSMPIGASTIMGSYQRADPNKGLDAMDVYSVGYTYDLSKRTNLYAFASYANRAAFVDGNKMVTVATGIRHRF
jgi:predicted porin